MKTESGLAFSVGVVAGLRPMTALAAMAWAVRRGRIQIEPSPIVVWMLSAGTSKRIAEFAISELIVDKLPFTPSRLNAAPLSLRIVSGAICGAAIRRSRKRSLTDGAVLGGLGALAGALTGYHVRKRLSRDMPDLAVALLEDAVAVGGNVLVVTLARPAA
ncbi:MAG: hypothetical protein DMG05_26670 [Acidobacteria bacterium]|nr:MAG: hypothetical protein DMG05_26670 [Acidobacteriota bacterium]